MSKITEMKPVQIKKATIKLIQLRGLINVGLTDVCLEAGLPDGSFKHYMNKSFTEFMHELIEEGHFGPPMPADKKKNDAVIMRTHILNMAIDRAKKIGYKEITVAVLSKDANVSRSTIHKLFPQKQLHRLIMREAIHRNAVHVVAQGLVINDPVADFAPEVVKKAARDWMASQ